MNKKLTLALQLVCAFIIGTAGVLKLTDNPTDQLVFAALNMEPFGRYLIATLELLSASLLLSGMFAASGALVAIGTMLGAVIAHTSVLGAEVHGDGGLHLLMLMTVLATSGPVLFARRCELPLIGSTL